MCIKILLYTFPTENPPNDCIEPHRLLLQDAKKAEAKMLERAEDEANEQKEKETMNNLARIRPESVVLALEEGGQDPDTVAAVAAAARAAQVVAAGATKQAVHCQMSPWSEWGSCSDQCGGGKQSKTRSVVVQAAHDGQACPSALEEQQLCNAHACRW